MQTSATYSAQLRTDFESLKCSAEFWSLRHVANHEQRLAVRSGVMEPLQLNLDSGVMLTVIDGGGLGYAATADLSRTGLQAALDRAHQWARLCTLRPTTRFAVPEGASARGSFSSPHWNEPLPAIHDLLEILLIEDAAAGQDKRIVDRQTELTLSQVRHTVLTSRGGEVEQTHRFITPNIVVTAYEGGQSQTRSLAGQYNGFCRQGGFDVLLASGLIGSGGRVADEALQLLYAQSCPVGSMDLLVMPDQMMLQIHESIGHPLELDRILGDERNFAGSSFVTLDMFGHYRYGSDLLNVSFDPTRGEQFASYAFDDDGSLATKALLIEQGVLRRPLGSSLSARRARDAGGQFEAVANSRASNWNRPPIDRMANLNIEPGISTLDDMIAGIDNGLLVKTNCSWSIDDQRNKFQFGCEWGHRIEHGRLTTIVRNPNYRGVSANFWRNLKAVGDASTYEILGTPYCGKGEPGQTVRVGHASPACVFANVDVFGGAA